MTYSVPRAERWLATGLVLAGLSLGAQPASAIPIVDLGAHAGAAVHLTGNGPAADLYGDVYLRELTLSAQYWTRLGGTDTYLQGLAGYRLPSVPVLSITPAVGVAGLNGAFGPLGNVTAKFEPFLLPVSLEAAAGAAYVQGNALFPYHAGLKFSPLPFTALTLRYRGWGGTPGATLGNGPEIGLEIGL